MKGSHNIIVETEHMKYTFTIRRNITIVLGDSGTGKSTLVDYLNMYSRRGIGSGVTLQSDVPCIVLNDISGQWRNILSGIRQSIIFIDEGQPFIFTEEFAAAVRDSDNYYVLITRRPLRNLPYSTQEIYGIRTTGRYHFPEKVYQEFYPIYDTESKTPVSKKTILLVEDSESGFDFFQHALPNIKCISASGNSNIATRLSDIDNNEPVIILADGAAFGAYIENIISLQEIRGNTGIYLPESFEWLILRSGVINNTEIPEILEHPENFIDSKIYFSWERYFTDLLEKKTAIDDKIRYSKSRIANYYLSNRCINKILEVIPEDIRKTLMPTNTDTE